MFKSINLDPGAVRSLPQLLTVLFILFLLGPPPLLGQEREPRGLYRILIDTAYSNNPISEFQSYLKAAPTTVIPETQKLSDRSFAEIIKFRFGLTQASETYNLLLDRIADLNATSSISKLKSIAVSGELKIPAIPRSWTSPGERRTVETLGLGKLRPLESAFIAPGDIDEFYGSFSPTRYTTIELPSDSAPPLGELLSQPLVVNLAEDTCYPGNCLNDYIPASLQLSKNLIDNLNQLKQIQRTVVVIVDTNFPSTEARASAFAFFRTLARAFWKDQGLRREASNDFLEQSSLPEEPISSSPNHANCINEILEVASRQVLEPPNLIYLPMLPIEGAEPIFRELLTIKSFTGYTRNIDDPLAPERRPAVLKALKRARNDAGLILKYFLEEGSLFSPSLLTDKAFLDALYYSMNWWSSTPIGGVYFINHSWLLSKPIALEPPVQPNGLVLAALGNNSLELDGNSNAYPALESINSSFFLPVENLSPEGNPLCCTNFLNTALRSTIWSFGLEGRQEGMCGTSFSAPRAAWLLASIESRRVGSLSRPWLLDFQRHRESVSNTDRTISLDELPHFFP